MWAGPQQYICAVHCSMVQHRRTQENIPGASCHAGLSPQYLQPGSWQPALPQHGGCYAPAAAVASSPGCRSPVQCVVSALLQHTMATHACQMQSRGRVAQLKAGSSNVLEQEEGLCHETFQPCCEARLMGGADRPQACQPPH